MVFNVIDYIGIAMKTVHMPIEKVHFNFITRAAKLILLFSLIVISYDSVFSFKQETIKSDTQSFTRADLNYDMTVVLVF
jgi:hypothetical protein